MRTTHRIVAPAQLAGAAQTALVGDAGLWLSVGHAWAAAADGLLSLAAAVVPTSRLAALAGQSAPLSSACSSELACLFCPLVDGSLAPMWISVLKLCSGSCTHPYACVVAAVLP